MKVLRACESAKVRALVCRECELPLSVINRWEKEQEVIPTHQPKATGRKGDPTGQGSIACGNGAKAIRKREADLKDSRRGNHRIENPLSWV